MINIKQSGFVAIILILWMNVIAQAQDSNKLTEQYNRILETASLGSAQASDVAIREVFWPPGWKAAKHYHNSNLFIYVIEGDFEVITESDGIKLYSTGDTLRMRPDTVMDARNTSEIKPLKLVVFQVGEAGSAFSVPVE